MMLCISWPSDAIYRLGVSDSYIGWAVSDSYISWPSDDKFKLGRVIVIYAGPE